MSNNDNKEKLTSLLCWEKIYELLPDDFKKQFISYNNRIRLKPIEYFDSYYAWLNLRQTLIENLPEINELNKNKYPWIIKIVEIYNHDLNIYNIKNKSD